MTNRSSGQIITFYSYKGGTGRTMALANLACLLTRQDSSRKEPRELKVLAIDWDFEAPGLHRFLYPYIEPDSQKRFEDAPGCLELFEHLSNTNKTSFDPKDYVGNRNLAKSKLEALNFKDYLLPTIFPGLFLMKAGLFGKDYSRRASIFDWEDLFRTTIGLFSGFVDFLRDQFDFVLVDSRTGITDTSGICTMLLPDKLVVVFTPNQQSLTGIESLVHKAVSYRKGSPDGRPLTVFPLPSRVEMARPQLLEAWRKGNIKNSDTAELLPPKMSGYQQIFERLFTEIYGQQDICLDDYFNEVILQHIPDYAYGEPIAVALESTESRVSLSSSYKAFKERLIELEVPWGSLETARLEREINRMCGSINDKLQEGAIDEAVRLSFALVERKLPKSQFDCSMNAIFNVAHAASNQGANEEAVALIKRISRVVRKNSDLDLAIVGQVLLDAGKLSREFGDSSLAMDLLHASQESFTACFGYEHPTTQMAMIQMATTCQDQGDYEGARKLYQQSIEIAEKLGDLGAMANSYLQQGNLYQNLGDYDSALVQHQKALKLYEKLRDLGGMADTYHQMASLDQNLGNYDDALEQCRKAWAIFDNLGDRHGMANSYLQMASLDQNLDKYNEALEQCRKAVGLFENIGDRRGMADTYLLMGRLQHLQGEHKAAKQFYEQSLLIKKELIDRLGIAFVFVQLGLLMHENNLDSDAFKYSLRAFHVMERLQTSEVQKVLDQICNIAKDNPDVWKEWLFEGVEDEKERSHIEKRILKNMEKSAFRTIEIRDHEWLEYYDRFKYFSPEKVRDGCQPRIMEHPNAQKAVVLIHGLTDSPYYMTAIGEYFHQEIGYNVYIPLLHCHGLKKPRGMQDAELEEWKNNVGYAIESAETRCRRISIGGLSTGGTLSFYMAATNPKINGTLYLFSAALDLAGNRFELLGEIKERLLRTPLADLFDSKKNLIGKNPYRYDHMDLDGARELARLIKVTDTIIDEYDPNAPFPNKVFAAHSECDMTASISGIEELQKVSVPNRFLFYRIGKKYNVSHASLVLKDPIIANGKSLEDRNPRFQNMMDAIAAFDSDIKIA